MLERVLLVHSLPLGRLIERLLGGARQSVMGYRNSAFVLIVSPFSHNQFLLQSFNIEAVRHCLL